MQGKVSGKSNGGKAGVNNWGQDFGGCVVLKEPFNSSVLPKKRKK